MLMFCGSRFRKRFVRHARDCITRAGGNMTIAERVVFQFEIYRRTTAGAVGSSSSPSKFRPRLARHVLISARAMFPKILALVNSKALFLVRSPSVLMFALLKPCWHRDDHSKWSMGV